MIVRREHASDYDEVYQVVRIAFESAEHSDGNEQDLVNALRNGNAFIPDLSLVAEEDDKIIGHIMFTRAYVNDSCVLVLAPLSVLPHYQNKGVGSALISEGHRIASSLGYEYSVVLGSPTYYSKFGYKSARKYGIIPPFDVSDEYFMAYQLNNHAKSLDGVLIYPNDFGI